MSVKFIDIHTHKDYTHFDVIRLYSFRMVPEQAVQPVSGPFACGVHPWDTDTPNLNELLIQLNDYNNLHAIGECGFDKYRGGAFEIQEQAFRYQVNLSERKHKPLIIHCIGYYNELITLYKQLQPTQKWIVHGFNAHPNLAVLLINAGIYLSFGVAMANPLAKAAASIKVVPQNRLFLETDEANCSIQDVYKLAANHRNESVETIKHTIYKSYISLFES
jgi:TatD DNase family protein